MNNTNEKVTSNIKNNQSETKFFDYYMKEIVTGVLVGSVSSTLTFPIDKISFEYQTMQAQQMPQIKKILSSACNKPLAGYFVTIFNSACKNIFLFPAKAFFEKQFQDINPNGAYNKNYAGFVAGIVTVYITSPISVIKALRFNKCSVSEIKSLKLSALFRGVHSTALRDGVQFGVFFGLFPIISNYLSNPIFSGFAASLLGSVCSNPLSVIAMNQKITGASLVNEAIALYQQNGMNRFYWGFFKTTALRMGIQGAATGLGMSVAQKIYNEFVSHENPKL